MSSKLIHLRLEQLVTAYQELVGEGLNVALVMAGLPGAVCATLNDRVLTFLNRARKVTLEPLSVGDVDAYYQRAFEELDLDIPGDLRLRAARATQGSPYMLQLIGYNIGKQWHKGEDTPPPNTAPRGYRSVKSRFRKRCL